MTRPITKIEKLDQEFTDKNIWSSLGSEFRVFELKILEIIQQKIQDCLFDQQNEDLNQRDGTKDKIRSQIQNFEIEMKKKFSKIFFKCSVNESQAQEKTMKISELKSKVNSQRENYEAQIKDLNQKIKAHEKLLKVYEKALSQKKNKQIMAQKPDIEQIHHQTYHPTKQQHKPLNLDRLYSLKIESHEKKNSIQGNNLSFSRLTSSRMSSNRLDEGVLRELQNNWNKSVNLSSKSLKPANKGQQKSMKKEEKSFAKSHIKQKEFHQQSVKQNLTSIKINRQKKLNQSTISQFSLYKN